VLPPGTQAAPPAAAPPHAMHASFPAQLLRLQRCCLEKSLVTSPMDFFSVCSCEDRKSKETKQPKEAQIETPPLSPATTLQDKDPLFDGLVLARAPRLVEIDRSFETAPPEGSSSSPVPRAVATLSRAAAEPLSLSPLPSPSSRRSWRHSMAEVIKYPSIMCALRHCVRCSDTR